MRSLSRRRVDVERALAAAGLLDDDRNQWSHVLTLLLVLDVARLVFPASSGPVSASLDVGLVGSSAVAPDSSAAASSASVIGTAHGAVGDEVDGLGH